MMVRVDHIKLCGTDGLWWFYVDRHCLAVLNEKVWVYLSRFEATCSVDNPFARSADNASQSKTNTPPLPAGLTTVCLWLLICVRSESFFARADSSRQQKQRGSRILHTCHAFLLIRFTRPLESCKPLPIRWAKQLYHPLHYQQDRQRDAFSATRVRFIQNSSEHSVSTQKISHAL